MSQEVILFAAGNVDGHILTLYDRVLTLEKELGVRCDWVVSTGNFGVWPDPNEIDRGTKKHQGDAGDFPKLYVNKWNIPRSTLMVAGAHEDFIWLNKRYKQKDTQILPNLHYLIPGYQTNIGVTVVGLGKVFSPKVWSGNYNKRDRRHLKHYTLQDVQKACTQGPTDLFLSHQGPASEKFGSIKSFSKGIKRIIYATRPKLVLHSHYNFNKEYQIGESKIISLANEDLIPIVYDGDKFSKLI